jgi:hypothetical protein
MMRGLNKLYYLKIDIENIKDEIRSLPIISSPQVTGMPRGSGLSEPTADYVLKKEFLEDKLKQVEKKYEAEFVRIKSIIERIDDDEIQGIARMRLIDNMKWEDIGNKVHLERTTCAKKLKKYINAMDI